MTGKAHPPRPRLCSHLSPWRLSLTSLPRLSLSPLSPCVGPMWSALDRLCVTPASAAPPPMGPLFPENSEARDARRRVFDHQVPCPSPCTLPMAAGFVPRISRGKLIISVSCHVMGQVRIDLTSTYSMSFRSSFLDIRDWYVQIQPSRPSSLPPPVCPRAPPLNHIHTCYRTVSAGP